MRIVLKKEQNPQKIKPDWNWVKLAELDIWKKNCLPDSAQQEAFHTAHQNAMNTSTCAVSSEIGGFDCILINLLKIQHINCLEKTEIARRSLC